MNARTSLDLLERSLQVILANQQPGGAFLACPTMPDYQYSWFRDGAYISYALTLDGDVYSAVYGGSMGAQWESLYRFHSWCARVINDREKAANRAVEAARRGDTPEASDLFNARYRPDGQEGPDDWPEFQLDGLGTWLWSLSEYVAAFGCAPLPVEWERAVVTAAEYLAALWRVPCYDCWEERGSDVHVSTLGAIYAGLNAAHRLVPSRDYGDQTAQIKAFVLQHGLTPGGELAKSVGVDAVDANLLSVAVPHGMLAADDPVMLRTVARIERELCTPSGGVHRHLNDTYYGGGAWVLLALWLAWYYVELGQVEKAEPIIAWAEAQADDAGNLPEQVNTAMLAPGADYDYWVNRRGAIASPLLWTHAEYIIVRRKLAARA